MESNKKFDSVKMMREIRDKVSSDIKDMSPEQILEYIKKGRNEYDELMASHQQATIRQGVINA
jgi:hypothetical protein